MVAERHPEMFAFDGMARVFAHSSSSSHACGALDSHADNYTNKHIGVEMHMIYSDQRIVFLPVLKVLCRKDTVQFSTAHMVGTLETRLPS